MENHARPAILSVVSTKAEASERRRVKTLAVLAENVRHGFLLGAHSCPDSSIPARKLCSILEQHFQRRTW